MAINLEKNKITLQSTWEEVVSEKANTNWALFGYDGKSFDLKVVSKGDGGIEELTEDFSSGKIMYAFCKVLDPNTSLPKFVLINWQGEAAPLERKGKCANHINDVKRFFKGAHVTINARTEDDVDAKIIIDKVSKSTASAFNFKERLKPDIEAKKPVGSVYKRVIPTAEINAIERDKFWEKEEAEEKKRLEVEQKKAEEISRKLDEERRIRELEEAKNREEMVKQRIRSISEIREAEKINYINDKQLANIWEQDIQSAQEEESERKQRSESLRNQRKQEAQDLIAQRNINARAIFEQNTSAGQMSTYRETNGKRNSSPNIYSVQRPDIIPTTPPPDISSPLIQWSPQSNSIGSPPQSIPSISSPSEVQNLLKGGLPQRPQESDDEQEDSTWANEEERTGVTRDLNEEPFSDGQGLCARALYDYQAADETEISFDPDDIISHIDQIDEGWWQGMAPNGTYGLFPANYVELLE